MCMLHLLLLSIAKSTTPAISTQKKHYSHQDQALFATHSDTRKEREDLKREGEDIKINLLPIRLMQFRSTNLALVESKRCSMVPADFVDEAWLTCWGLGELASGVLWSTSTSKVQTAEVVAWGFLDDVDNPSWFVGTGANTCTRSFKWGWRYKRNVNK